MLLTSEDLFSFFFCNTVFYELKCAWFIFQNNNSIFYLIYWSDSLSLSRRIFFVCLERKVLLEFKIEKFPNLPFGTLCCFLLTLHGFGPFSFSNTVLYGIKFHFETDFTEITIITWPFEMLAWISCAGSSAMIKKSLKLITI